MPHRFFAAAVLLAGAIMVGGCTTSLSSANPAGPQAERINDLTWMLVAMGTLVFLIVLGALLFALHRGSRRDESASGEEVERGMRLALAVFVGVTAVILLFILVVNFRTGRALAEFSQREAMVIRVTGHQWWWEVEYVDPRPNRRVLTANEIHIPVGHRVHLELVSRDVIHSFWAPNLHGKLDLIPGYTGQTTIQARACCRPQNSAQRPRYTPSRSEWISVSSPNRPNDSLRGTRISFYPQPHPPIRSPGPGARCS